MKSFAIFLCLALIPLFNGASAWAQRGPGFSGGARGPGFNGTRAGPGFTGVRRGPGFSGTTGAGIGFDGRARGPGFSPNENFIGVNSDPRSNPRRDRFRNNDDFLDPFGVNAFDDGF